MSWKWSQLQLNEDIEVDRSSSGLFNWSINHMNNRREGDKIDVMVLVWAKRFSTPLHLLTKTRHVSLRNQRKSLRPSIVIILSS